MDEAIFRDEPMGLRTRMLALPLPRRYFYDEEQNTLFINFEGLTVKSEADIEAIHAHASSIVAPVVERNGQRVDVIVNYDNFRILPELLEPYATMVHGLEERFYANVSRHSASNFLRLKLGSALKERGLAPHIYEHAKQRH